MRLENVEVSASLGLTAVAILVETRCRGCILVRGKPIHSLFKVLSSMATAIRGYLTSALLLPVRY